MRNSVDGVMGHYGRTAARWPEPRWQTDHPFERRLLDRKSDGFDKVVEPMLVQQLIQTLIE